ncbi:histone-lysine N-methyltransferase SETD1A-like [Pollicipes pollicipes]|uniref:histone-lysine N-methyltransferase SETD1A-like n=1 Tax=Pollicipes pollicipes TaxID=41117 RepID=UPI0018856C61|nr:histone-lysine N-methyltransferase SETD1A-like [Pollicipes pollicipes]
MGLMNGCLEQNVGSSRGLEQKVGSSRGLEQSVGSSRGLEQNVGSSRGLEQSVGSSRGLEQSVGSSRGLEQNTRAAAGLLRLPADVDVVMSYDVGPEPPPPTTPAERKEGSESPGANAGVKWSLRSIMNKDPAGTPVSSIFEDTPARKLSPHEFPNSSEPAGPSSAETLDLNGHGDDISIEELVSQVEKCDSITLSDGPVSMEMSESSSSSEDECAPPAEPAASASVRSTTGGKRPRPRLSALSESDSEKLERSKRRAPPPPADGPPRRPGRPRVKLKPSPRRPPGVGTSDANKKATFSRLFSRRISGKRGTPRGRPTTSSERSEGDL